MKKRYAIGIDPGVNTGYAVYDRTAHQIIDKGTLDFWRVYHWIGNQENYAEYVVYIETPNSQRPMYDSVDGNSDIGRIRENMSAKIGSNRREAALLADGIELLGFEVKRIRPTRTKWTAEQLKRNTRITERTNQHVRDAIALVWGI